ncbi:MAG: hypothetical protein JW900_07385 [Anaerolineae bacterium]|nr:hypothetical protein [Anaerolineae bacterium]
MDFDTKFWLVAAVLLAMVLILFVAWSAGTQNLKCECGCSWWTPEGTCRACVSCPELESGEPLTGPPLSTRDCADMYNRSGGTPGPGCRAP